MNEEGLVASTDECEADVAENTPVDTDTEQNTPTASEPESTPTDYEKMAADDLDALRRDFPELCEIDHISELDNPLRYAALRDLGLSPAEAYLATRKRGVGDSRSHLFGAVSRSASAPAVGMSQSQLAEARELFGNMSDTDIQKLYRKVSG